MCHFLREEPLLKSILHNVKPQSLQSCSPCEHTQQATRQGPSSRTVARDEIKRLSSHSVSPARSPASTTGGKYNYNVHAGNHVSMPPTQSQENVTLTEGGVSATRQQGFTLRVRPLPIIKREKKCFKKISVLQRDGNNKDRHRWELAAVCAQLGAGEEKGRAAHLVPEQGC